MVCGCLHNTPHDGRRADADGKRRTPENACNNQPDQQNDESVPAFVLRSVAFGNELGARCRDARQARFDFLRCRVGVGRTSRLRARTTARATLFGRVHEHVVGFLQRFELLGRPVLELFVGSETVGMKNLRALFVCRLDFVCRRRLVQAKYAQCLFPVHASSFLPITRMTRILRESAVSHVCASIGSIEYMRALRIRTNQSW